MDMTGVEGLADLIAASTASQRKQVPHEQMWHPNEAYSVGLEANEGSSARSL